MIIDTHSHLNFNAYKKDLDEIVKRTLNNDIWAINVGSKYETSKRAVEIAQNYKGIYAAIGMHPIFAAAEFQKVKTDPEEGEFLVEEEEFDYEKYKKLAKSPKVVAIGEIGLDYYYKPKTKAKLEQFKEKQKLVFLQQLELAKELNLPVIFHCRVAHKDLYEILKSKNMPGVIHCFSGNWQEAQHYLDLGLYLGFNGIIFKLDLDEVVRKTPLEKILVETDCPYLTPPQEGDKRNEPIFVKHVIQKVAELKSINFQEVADRTTKNAEKLFGIDKKG